MTEHVATVRWRRSSADFTFDSYNRAHEWQFDGGVLVPASAAPDYRGDAERVDPERVDPEQAFVAALSSCHMLTFLAVAARKRFVVDAYDDRAVGTMSKNERGKLWVSRVVLRPTIHFTGERQPTTEQLARMHELAHGNCFIANSVQTEVVVEAAADAP